MSRRSAAASSSHGPPRSPGSLGSSLPAGTLIAEAARAQRAVLPRPRNVPIDHVVVVMMENRSFDHYFGWLHNADGDQTQTYVDGETGARVPTRHARTLEAEWQGCGHPDPGHGWESGRAQLQGGFLAKGSGNDEFALTYYDEGDIEFLHAAAAAYTVYDRFFCSVLSSTWPNRYYKWSAQSGGLKDNAPPLETAGNQWETIFDRALGRGLSARYYNSDLPFSAVWGARGASWTRPLAEYYADCALGTLPNVAFVDPPFRDGGGGDGVSADEHPHGDVRLGQAWMADVVRAFVHSKNYRRGALFVVYDEWGGFFDHVRPPRVRDARASADLSEDFGQMGFRIPAVAVSPSARRRRGRRETRVRHATLGFESILKLITYRFGLGELTVRDRHATNIGETFDWAHPRFEPPDLPDPEHVASRPCALGGGDVLTQESSRSSPSVSACPQGTARSPTCSRSPTRSAARPSAARSTTRSGQQDQHRRCDHQQPQQAERDPRLPLVAPVGGVRAVPRVPALGRLADPVVVVGHALSLPPGIDAHPGVFLGALRPRKTSCSPPTPTSCGSPPRRTPTP
jgi:phospholipase C